MRILLLALTLAAQFYSCAVKAQQISGALVATGVPRAICLTGAASSITGDTNETTLATCTVPANSMGANGVLRITTQWSHTNSANNKTLRVKFSGTNYLSVNVTTTATSRVQSQITNRNATNSQVGNNNAIGSFGGSSGGLVTSTIDTTVSHNIVITGTLANSGETITLESYLVELIPFP